MTAVCSKVVAVLLLAHVCNGYNVVGFSFLLWIGMLCVVSTLVVIAGEEWVRCFVNCTFNYVT